MAEARPIARQRHLDAKAREAGYRDWAALEAFQRKRMKPVTNTAAAPASGWWETATAWHPAYVFKKVAGLLGQANHRAREQ